MPTTRGTPTPQIIVIIRHQDRDDGRGPSTSVRLAHALLPPALRERLGGVATGRTKAAVSGESPPRPHRNGNA